MQDSWCKIQEATTKQKNQNLSASLGRAFARLASGAFYCFVQLKTFYENIKIKGADKKFKILKIKYLKIYFIVLWGPGFEIYETLSDVNQRRIKE